MSGTCEIHGRTNVMAPIKKGERYLWKSIQSILMQYGIEQGVSGFRPIIRLNCWLMRISFLSIVQSVVRSLRRAESPVSKRARP